jgi:ABC-2 type transport system permease protein
MQAFIHLVKKEVHRFMSIWVQTIVGPMSTAVLYQLIFGKHFSGVHTLGSISYGAFLIPGLVMMQVLLNSFGNSSSSLIQSKYTGNLIFILMAPITPFAMYSAYLVSSMIRGIIVGIAVLVSIIWFDFMVPVHPFILLFFLVFGSSITAGIGLIAGIIYDKFDKIGGLQSFVIVPLIYLAGVFFNPQNLGGIWGKIALFDPFLYIIDGFRYSFISHKSANIQFGIFFVLSLSIIINFAGYMILKKGIKIKN